MEPIKEKNMAKLTITTEIDDTDQLVLKNDLLDIEEWVRLAVAGKLITVGSVCNKSGLQN